jgi:hypothetical protein
LTVWLREHEALLGWLAALSAVTFLATLLLVPILIARLPEDYFLPRRRHSTAWGEQHGVMRLLLKAAKNALGLLFIACGVAMLLLPGQGILTIIIGIVLADFPGKYRLERWLASRPRVLRAMNWIRRRARRPPLRAPAAPSA